MQKILTVSIAAYNVEKVLRKALDSCVVPAVLDVLEVIVVNDGSKDGTSQIAHEYSQRYPDTFIVVDKENGGYGSTVNKSLEIARGRYFRLLDGDDWFHSDGLEKFIRFLQNCEADLILSGRTEVREDGSQKHSDNRWFKMYADKLAGKTVPIGTLEPFVYGIWVATYKTELLTSHPFQLPLHQLYTDRLFIVYPLPFIRTVAFQNYDVYCYRIGDENQSVSVKSKIAHYQEVLTGFDMILDYYSRTSGAEKANDSFMVLRIARYYKNVINTLFLLPPSRKHRIEIKQTDKKVASTSREIYDLSGKIMNRLRIMRLYSYELYWLFRMKKIENWY